MKQEEIEFEVSLINEKLKSLGLDYMLCLTDKNDITFLSNISVKEATVLLYALSKQSDEFKTVIQAVFYQLQKDKESEIPIIFSKMANA